ncbi:hypothetical protein BX661DRAFT_186553 [Kickxella alabastrina]|uniref:uncharacterized protein n=1 Tax=Kickxella alabastrina TaxID=61397 RepID=UPI00222065F2|nr:uncharacterized protein BX661DRAFT_186553 [Kickxella alabastrina]KAI7823413.1 hypothetical protein BX661DRAFT_186553 [Kickxella alabastrina]
MSWSQVTHTFPPRSKGSYLRTAQIQIGMCNLFLQHTSASLCLNENVCREVREDLTMALDHIAPETLKYKHTDEGPDDMPGHDGQLALGTWQGIYLNEHRTYQHRRTVIVTMQGEKRK